MEMDGFEEIVEFYLKKLQKMEETLESYKNDQKELIIVEENTENIANIHKLTLPLFVNILNSKLSDHNIEQTIKFE